MLRLFGTPFVDGGDAPQHEAPPKRLFALIALLALSHNNSASRSALAAALWENADTGRAQGSLRHLLAATRHWQARQGCTLLEVSSARLARGPGSVRADLDSFLAIDEIKTG